MGNFPVIKPKELIKILESRGFIVLRIKGSHAIMRRTSPATSTVTVPIHNKPLKRGTLLSILRYAGISKEEI